MKTKVYSIDHLSKRCYLCLSNVEDFYWEDSPPVRYKDANTAITDRRIQRPAETVWCILAEEKRVRIHEDKR